MFNKITFVPSIERLEQRAMPAVKAVNLSATGILTINSDDNPTQVRLKQIGINYIVEEVGTSKSWSYKAATEVVFNGGNGNDTFINASPLRVTARGYGGNDYLQGGPGNDLLLGGPGNDVFVGGAGDDTLIGGLGNDRIDGGLGDDSIVLIDAAFNNDSATGGLGRDSFWVDFKAGKQDYVADLKAEDSEHDVEKFTNGADMTFDGDRIADPTPKSSATAGVSGTAGVMEYKRFDGKPLFSSKGPQVDDIKQGALGDCWLLAGLSAIAKDNAPVLKMNMVDFGDSTYGVRYENNFYRVDNDFPVYPGTTNLSFSQFGSEGSVWVVVAEKAFVYYRNNPTPPLTYESIEGGRCDEVNKAFRAVNREEKSLSGFSAATLSSYLVSALDSKKAVTFGFGGTEVAKIVGSHGYTLTSYNKDASGKVISFVVRNPWGEDGGVTADSKPLDGYVTITADDMLKISNSSVWVGKWK